VFEPSMWLDGQYTVWGRVIEGMDAVDAIERGEPPANPTKIVKAYILGQ
jgi:cyclophilin family peptidyl-prolyl cis-trans isomerase